MLVGRCLVAVERLSLERALADVQALRELLTELEHRLDNAVIVAWGASVPRVAIARALGVNPSTLYRHYPVVAS